MKATLLWHASLALLTQATLSSARAEELYANDFNGPPGSSYPERTSSAIVYASPAAPPGKGVRPAPLVTSVESPNHAQRFLGEFGGPASGAPGDPGYNRTRVEQTVSLALHDLPAHTALRVSFDLYILKSWDGRSPVYGPDRWSLKIAGGATLLETTFSNNPKVAEEGSSQDYPQPGSPPRSGAVSTGTLGYSPFFRDSIYHFAFTVAHAERRLTLEFGSSLMEGKGIADESWGLDNVRISSVTLEAERP